jgi:hypothetical protein
MKISRFILIVGLFLLGGLAVLSVYGAFLGPEKASAFFNSPSMTVFWFIFVGILLGGFLFFRRLWTRPFLFMIHLGCLLVLFGGLWGSRQGIAIRKNLLKADSLYKGLIPLYEREGSSVLYDAQANPVGSLPFEVFLKEFQVHYYDQPQFLVRDKKNPRQVYTVPVKLGQVFDLGEGIQFSAAHAFRNLQIQIHGENKVAVEGPEGVANPGYEVLLRMPDGSHEMQYVFERRAMHTLPRYRFEILFQPPQMPSEYISELVIIENGQEKVRKRIEVNHPLSYKGYLLHQKSWGQDSQGVYSVIGVVSNSGAAAVFAGYGFLTAGLVGQLWIIPAVGRTKGKGGRS